MKHIDDFRRTPDIAASVRDVLADIRARGMKDGLNCVAEIDESAIVQAESLQKAGDRSLPLFGVPVLIKDNIDVKGLHTTAGSLALNDNIADADAPVVVRLRSSGAVIVGKTNMTEFANFTTKGMPGGYSSRGGQVIHALDPALSPSGSSSGSGVAVSAGIVPCAVGTDTSFSVIACAQANGICGIKPPAGLLSTDSIIPIARTLDSAGAMAGNFTDALTLMNAMQEKPLTIEPAEVHGLNIAVNTANRDMVSKGQTAFLADVLDALKQRGCRVSEIDEPYSPYLMTIMRYEFKPHLEAYLAKSNASRKTLAEIVEYYEKNPETMLKYGDILLRESLYETEGGLQSETYREAMENRKNSILRVQSEIAPFDAAIMTGPTNIMHYCGLPSVTVTGRRKIGKVPRSLILYGADEERLCRAALAIEKLLP